MPMTAQGQHVTVEGRTLRLTNLDKVLFAGSGTTKAELLYYYSEIAPLLLPSVRDRPMTRKRWPEGAGRTDGGRELVFFTKNIDSGTPEWVRRVRVQHSDRPVDYPVADDVATLTWFAQLAAIELHVPQWRFDPRGRPQHPDRLVLDLDPGPGVGLAECALVARSARDLLAELELTTVPVTSGSKGIHLYAALDGSRSSEEVSTWARDIAGVLQRLHPDLVISVMRRSERPGKVFVDWSQNNGSKTTIAPYSLRGRGRPWVAAPRTWDELDDPGLAQLELTEVLERAGSLGDPMAVLLGEDARLASRRPGTRPTHLPESVAGPLTPAKAHARTSPTQRPEPVEGPPTASDPPRRPRRPDPEAATPTADADGTFLPMLASSPVGRRDTFTDADGWVFEMKWDGVRAVVHADEQGVQLVSRRGLAMAATYPELTAALEPLRVRRAVLDAEVVALDAAGRPSFARLQQRINLARAADVARVARGVPVQLICFDLLQLDGERLVDRPYEERRELLETLVDEAGLDARVQVPPSLGQDFAAAMEVSRAMGMEGLVAKRLGSRYHPGARSEQWVKIKVVKAQEVVVIGWKAGQGSRDGALGSLVMAVPRDGGLHYAGRVGTGFSQAALAEAARLLEPLRRRDCPVPDVPRPDTVGVTWVEPELVGEVEYMDWTPTGRIRHPSWRGWRPDRTPADVVVDEDASAG